MTIPMSIVRVALATQLLFAATATCAAVTCEQLGEIAYVTERLRDNGTSLAEVMQEADRLEAERFSDGDMLAIRETIENAFKRTRNTNETLVECIAKRKK